MQDINVSPEAKLLLACNVARMLLRPEWISDMLF